MRRDGSIARRTGLAAVLASGAVLAAVLAPSSAQAATASVRGTVTVGGKAVAGVPVGTWNPSRGVVTEGRTDARGRFVLHSPAGTAVSAWAGARPSAAHAVFVVGDRHLVRGVVGDAQPAGLATPLWQRTKPVVPARLGVGGIVRFRLQGAGRFVASVAGGGTGRIALQRGGSYGPWYREQDGTITSGWLVPASYTVYWDPKPGRLPARTRVTVPSGTVEISPAALPVLPVGTTVRIRATSGGAALPSGVPVVEQRADGTTGSAPSTDASGSVTLTSVTPGTHRYTIGAAFRDPDEGYSGQPTSDDYLPATIAVTVAEGQTTAEAAVELAPASRIRGTVAVSERTSVRLLAQDADGNAVRVGYADEHGAFTIAGLRSGSYTVVAEDLTTHHYDRATVAVGAGATGVLPRTLATTTPDPVLRGTVGGGRPGAVIAQSRAYGVPLIGERDDFTASGAYAIPLPPGSYGLQVEETGRADRTAGTVLVDGTTARRDLQPGPKRATVAVRFAVRGNVVHLDAVALREDGEVLSLVPDHHGGQVSRSVAPGTYTWETPYSIPAADGPWTYSRPAPSVFTVKAGTTTDLGKVAVTIRG